MVCCAQQACGCSGGAEDLRAVPVQRHRRGAERAADLAHGGGALHPVVAVGVVGGEAAELVPGQLAGLAVVVRGLLFGGGAGERPEFGQRPRCLGAVQVAVADDRAVVGALGAAVMGMEVLDELGAGGPQRDGPGAGVAVRVAGVAEDVAERDLLAGQRGQHGGEGADRVVPGRRQRGAAGELGDGGPVLLGHHDPGRRGSTRRTARPGCAAGCSCGAPRTPRGRRSRWCRAAGGGRRIPGPSSPPPATGWHL